MTTTVSARTDSGLWLAPERLEAQTAALQPLAERVLQMATQAGASAAKVSIAIDQGCSINARHAGIEQVERSAQQTLTLVYYCDHYKSAVTTSDFSLQSLQLLVEKAHFFTTCTQADPFADLIEAQYLAFDAPTLNIYSPWLLSVDAAQELALQLEAEALAYDPRVTQVEHASVSSELSYELIANTHGFLAQAYYSEHSLYCHTVAEAEDERQTDYCYTVARHADQLMPVQEVAREASRLSVERLGARSLDTQTCPVIFDSRLAPGLFSNFVRAVRGQQLYHRSSFLCDSLGTQVFPEALSLTQKPYMDWAMASTPFDAEGAKVHEQDYVTDGKVSRYVLDSYSARQLGLEPTGNTGGVYNLVVDDRRGLQHRADLLKQIDRGVLVTELMGQGVSLATGDYSRGAAGYWVEGGEIQYPVAEITIAGNLRDMFSKVIALGDDVNQKGSIHVGSVAVDGMVIAGSS